MMAPDIRKNQCGGQVFVTLTASAMLLRQRRINRIRAIRGALATEGNPLKKTDHRFLSDGKTLIP